MVRELLAARSKEAPWKERSGETLGRVTGRDKPRSSKLLLNLCHWLAVRKSPGPKAEKGRPYCRG